MILNDSAIGLYVHLPWCIKKCPYCDFNSHTAPKKLPETAYVSSLLIDLAQQISHFLDHRKPQIKSVFFGGGTPSLFHADAIKRLLAGIAQQCELLPTAEITLEANPGAIDLQNLAGYQLAGVNRISLGAQSFNDSNLSQLGRIHDRQQIMQALTFIATHFERFNIDIMFGLPNQTLEQLENDLSQALQFQPKHMSCYQLTLEPNTVFFRQPPVLPNEDCLADMQQYVIERLAKQGLERYEISAYAKPNERSVHNLNYWQFGNYLGIGCGAHGKLPQGNQIIRTKHAASPNAYMGANQQPILPMSKRILERDKPLEFMLNALRLTQGFSKKWLSQHGIQNAAVDLPFQKACDQGLLTIEDDWIKPTVKGSLFLNNLQLLFLPENETS